MTAFLPEGRRSCRPPACTVWRSNNSSDTSSILHDFGDGRDAVFLNDVNSGPAAEREEEIGAVHEIEETPLVLGHLDADFAFQPQRAALHDDAAHVRGIDR